MLDNTALGHRSSSPVDSSQLCNSPAFPSSDGALYCVTAQGACNWCPRFISSPLNLSTWRYRRSLPHHSSEHLNPCSKALNSSPRLQGKMQTPQPEVGGLSVLLLFIQLYTPSDWMEPRCLLWGFHSHLCSFCSFCGDVRPSVSTSVCPDPHSPQDPCQCLCRRGAVAFLSSCSSSTSSPFATCFGHLPLPAFR